MKRREFLRRTAPILAAPVLINGAYVRAVASGRGPAAAAVFATESLATPEIEFFGTLRGLYWLVVNLAARGPLVLLADDVHWADTESLRWLVFLVANGFSAATRGFVSYPTGNINNPVPLSSLANVPTPSGTYTFLPKVVYIGTKRANDPTYATDPFRITSSICHELGHAFFNLPDRYLNFCGTGRTGQYDMMSNNCSWEHFTLHDQGDNWAEVTEGTSMGWERERYSWEPETGTVTIETLDSNLWAVGSGWHYRLVPAGDGTDLHVTLNRVPKSLLARALAFLIPLVGARTLGKQFETVLRRAEER